MYSHRLIIRSRCIRSTGHSRYIPYSNILHRGLHHILLHRVKVVGVRKGTTGRWGLDEKKTQD